MYFRHLSFVKLSSRQVLVVLVLNPGIVQNKVIEVEKEMAQRDLDRISNYLNSILSGLRLTRVKERLLKEMMKEKVIYDSLLTQALYLSQQALTVDDEAEVYIEGQSNMLDQPEFSDVNRIRQLFRAFEEKTTIIELLNKALDAEGVQIFIGSEDNYREIEGLSIVTASYGPGTLGVIGPMRMDYSKVIPLVDYTSRLVTKMLKTH